MVTVIGTVALADGRITQATTTASSTTTITFLLQPYADPTTRNHTSFSSDIKFDGSHFELWSATYLFRGNVTLSVDE